MTEENIKEEKEQEEVQEELNQNEEVNQEETVAEEQEESNEAELTEEEKLKAEVQDFKNKYLRLYSEFENFRKRTSKEKSEFLLTANKDLIIDLLPVLDDFERAIKVNNETEELDAAKLKEGFELIYDKFDKIIKKKGVEEIEAHGKEFDTEHHEAITQIPAPSEDLKGKIVDVIEKGYKMGEKVIRYAKVIIGA